MDSPTTNTMQTTSITIPLALALTIGTQCPTVTRAQTSSEPRANAEVSSRTGPFRIESLEFLDEVDPSRSRRVPIKLHLPAKAGRYPLVLFSHGGAGTVDSFVYQAKHLASHGFVTLSVEHVFSDAERVKALARRGQGRVRERFDAAILEITIDPRAVLGRPKDISFAIDRALHWNATHPELSGRIDPDRIAVVGHSFGASTVLTLCGARPTLEYLRPLVKSGKGLSDDLSDPRIKVGVAMSPQGPGTSRFARESYRTIDRPLLCLSGSEDVQLGHDGTIQPATRRLEAFSLMPPKDKYWLWLHGADHLAFADNPKAYLFPSPSRADAQRIAKAMTLAFLRAYLQDDEAARELLSERGTDALCGEVVTKVEWYER